MKIPYLLGMLLLTVIGTLAQEEVDADSPEVSERAEMNRDSDESAAEVKEAAQEESKVAVAQAIPTEPIQVYGWRERILVKGLNQSMQAKLDTGAYSCSIHAIEKELFERDGKKWMRFVVTDPSNPKSERVRLEAPLVRIAKIKESGGKSSDREVVRLHFKLGHRNLVGDFNLNNRHNMLSPVLIGRKMIKTLGWVDPTRTFIADQKIFR